MARTFADRALLLARLYALLVGVLCFLMSAVACVLYVADSYQQKLKNVQVAMAATAQAIVSETNSLLVRLNRIYYPVCSEENLKNLRVEAFGTAYLSDIGVFDEKGQLLCSSLLGTLPAPLETTPPDTVHEYRGYKVEINNRVSVVIGDGRYRTTVVRMGRFNAVVNPKVLESLFRGEQGVIRFILPVGGSFPIYADPNLSTRWINLLSAPELLTESAYYFSWVHMAFIASEKVSDTRFVIQNVTPLETFLKTHTPILSRLALLSFALGVIAYLLIKPVFLRWNNLEHRIKALLTMEHLVCLYQPIVDLKTGAIVGCEVLMRLKDNGGALIFPDQVLPVVIARKLTWQLDEIVIRKALRELFNGLPAQKNFKIAFNLFPENIQCIRLRDLIESELPRSGVHHFQINLEVIEQAYQNSLFAEISRLKAAGYLISVDDFGTGFSNLRSIKSLSPSFLKIDKSFVFEMEDSTVRSSLIPEIIGIARAVGAQVIAEGIENEAQRKKLLAMGVEFGQGFHFAKPMSIWALHDFMKAAPHT
jgi:sensor c-di-GMP phosphodiesterase-like protein